MVRSRRGTLAALSTVGLTILSLAACGDSGSGADSGDDDGFSIERMLGEMPASIVTDDEQIQITAGDIDLATDQGNLTRPDPDDPPETTDWLSDWMLPLTGIPRGDRNPKVTLQLPQIVAPQQLQQNEAIVDEFGWSVLDVHTFIEFSYPPDAFTVLQADVTEDDLDDAIGPADDGVWRLGGDDYSSDIAGSTPARRLGESVRFAIDDGLLAASRSTPPIEEWLDGDGETLADDDGLAETAAALDDVGVYSAMIIRNDFAAGASSGPTVDDADLLEPFDTLGVGLTIDEMREAVGVFVYRHVDQDAAEANLDRVEDLFAGGASLLSGEPLSDLLELRDVSVDGNIVVATFSFIGTRPNAAWQMVFARDILTIHG